MRKDLYIQAMDAIPFSGDIEEQIYKRLQDEKQSYRKKMVFHGDHKCLLKNDQNT